MAALLATLRKSEGRTVDLHDTSTAGIALVHQAPLATGNLRHFSDTGLSLINPCPASPSEQTQQGKARLSALLDAVENGYCAAEEGLRPRERQRCWKAISGSWKAPVWCRFACAQEGGDLSPEQAAAIHAGSESFSREHHQPLEPRGHDFCQARACLQDTNGPALRRRTARDLPSLVLPAPHLMQRGQQQAGTIRRSKSTSRW